MRRFRVRSTWTADNRRSDNRLELEPWLRRLLFLAFVAGFLALALQRWPSSRAADYFQFWVVGQAIEQGITKNIYSESGRRQIREAFVHKTREGGSAHEAYGANLRPQLELAGTPFLYTVIYLLSSGSFDADYRTFRIISLLAFTLSLIGLCQMLGFSLWATAVILVFCTYASGPFAEELQWGNVNQLQVSALVAVLFIRKRLRGAWRGYLTGLTLGFLMTFKPNLLYVIVLRGFWELRNRRAHAFLQEAGGLLTAVVLSLVGSSLVLGEACSWLEWGSGLKTIATTKFVQGSFLGMVFGLRDLQTFTWVGALSLAATVLCLELCRLTSIVDRQARWLVDCHLVGLGILLYLLSSPYVHQHYFLLLIPSMLLVLRPRPQRPLLGFASAVLIMGYPLLMFVPPFDIVTCRLGAYAGAMLLYVLSFRDLCSLRQISGAAVEPCQVR